MVVGAQLYEVGQRGRATACPVLDMVGVQEALVLAAREAAAAIAAMQRAAKRR
jgi:hypothetical protein